MRGTGNRLDARFRDLQREGRTGLVIYTMAGDPDHESGLSFLRGLPEAGADIIELGMPFSDPVADGPAIQAAALRSLSGGGSLLRTLEILRRFREGDTETPVVLMGYYNPIYTMGAERFAREAAMAGADGVIVVDLPPEEASELTIFLKEHGVYLVFLATPTTSEDRLPVILEQAGGFLYYVSVAGITGTVSARTDTIAAAVARLKRHTDLPVAVGFGIKTSEAAGEVARVADAVVVGSAVVEYLAAGIERHGQEHVETVDKALCFVASLAQAVHAAKA